MKFSGVLVLLLDLWDMKDILKFFAKIVQIFQFAQVRYLQAKVAGKGATN